MHIACIETPVDITQKFLKLKRFIRVIEYFKRFIIICRINKTTRYSNILSTQIIFQALICCLKICYAQIKKISMEELEVSATSSLKTLHSFIVKEILFREGGSLQQSMLLYQTMRQKILPSNHHFANFVVSAEHISLHHAGPQHLIASLRQKYGIPRKRILVRTVIHQCLTCYRFKAQASQERTCELPSTRVQIF